MEQIGNMLLKIRTESIAAIKAKPKIIFYEEKYLVFYSYIEEYSLVIYAYIAYNSLYKSNI
jgi:hypothetical protein